MHKDEFCLNLENVIFNYLKKKYYFKKEFRIIRFNFSYDIAINDIH